MTPKASPIRCVASGGALPRCRTTVDFIFYPRSTEPKAVFVLPAYVLVLNLVCFLHERLCRLHSRYRFSRSPGIPGAGDPRAAERGEGETSTCCATNSCHEGRKQTKEDVIAKRHGRQQVVAAYGTGGREGRNRESSDEIGLHCDCRVCCRTVPLRNLLSYSFHCLWCCLSTCRLERCVPDLCLAKP